MRIFISYTHDSTEHMDRTWDLCERLRGDGVDCRIDQHEVSPKEGWPRWCRNQVQGSQFVLVVCTETYKRRYEGKAAKGKGLGAKWEGFFITQELYEAEGKNSKFIPIVFSPGETAQIPVELRGATHYVLNSESSYERLFRHLTNQPARLKSDVAPQVRSMPPRLRKEKFSGPPWNVPLPRNPFFTGREEKLKELEDGLNASGLVALTGMGGTGKTQVAAEYSYRHRDRYSAVLWTSALSRETLISDLAALAKLMDLPLKDEPDQMLAVDAVRHWLTANRGWLLVFDNVDDVTIVHEFAPSRKQGHVMLTTQARATGSVRSIPITDMLPEEGALLLLRRAKKIGERDTQDCAGDSDRDVAAQISAELEGSPLAIDQAAAYIEETGCGLQDYLGLYRRRRADLMRRRGSSGPNHPESIATTIALSLEKVQRTNEAAAELLRFSAFLSSDAIPEEVLSEGASELGPLLAPVAGDPAKINEAFAETMRYSLLHRDGGLHTFSVHNLVQLVLRDSMDEGTQKQWAERAVKAVRRALPDFEFSDWARCELLLPQALACAHLIERWNFEFSEAADLFNESGYYLHERGRDAEAEPLVLTALRITKVILGDGHPKVAIMLGNLGKIYGGQRKYGQAESVTRNGIAIAEKAFDRDHPGAAAAIDNLAVILRDKGKYVDAEPLCRRALAIREKALGADHSDVAESLNNLGLICWNQGKFTEAESAHRLALQVREKALGPNHPLTAASLNNLGMDYLDQGKYRMAEPLFKRGLKIIEERHGPSHPRIATFLNNLGLLYTYQARYSAADPLYQRALAIIENSLGPKHRDIAPTLNNIGLSLHNQGQRKGAEVFYRRALDVCESTFGKDDPKVATTLENLAKVLREEKRITAAKELEARARAIRDEQGKQNSAND